MKKVISILLIFTLACLCAAPALAVTDTTAALTLSADKTTVSVNEIVTITVAVSENSKLGALEFSVDFDRSAFQYVDGSYTQDSLWASTVNPNHANGLYYSAATAGFITQGGTLVTFQLRALKPGSVLTLSVIQATDGTTLDGEDVTQQVVANSTDSLKIACSHAGTMTETEYTAPTCTQGGERIYTCSVCGETSIEQIPASGHSFGEWEQTSAPTCTQDGMETRVCAACKATETRVLAATGHDYTAVVTAPTCTKQGYTTHTCSICGDSYTDEYKAALGHSYTAVVTAPTCTKDGFTTHTCTTCGDSYIDSIVPAMGHTAGEWAVTKEPTHTETGLRTQSCEVCSEVLATEEIDVLTGLVGDVNEDGMLNAIDARWALQTAADLRVLRYSTLADVNGDGTVSVVDARWILQAAAGLRTL